MQSNTRRKGFTITFHLQVVVAGEAHLPLRRESGVVGGELQLRIPGIGDPPVGRAEACTLNGC
jgi:hypothetical protein